MYLAIDSPNNQMSCRRTTSWRSTLYLAALVFCGGAPCTLSCMAEVLPPEYVLYLSYMSALLDINPQHLWPTSLTLVHNHTSTVQCSLHSGASLLRALQQVSL